MNISVKRPKYGYYIGKASNKELRFKATSGGIGSAITQYLISTEDYDTALTFTFDEQKCMYQPAFVHSVDEINVCGSIYQDIDIPTFLRNHLGEIKKGVIISAPPCQIFMIRHILKHQNVKSFVISFCCSGQISIEGTWKYYNILGVKKDNVQSMQYRGNGWPSGIQIKMNNGELIKRNNWSYPWTLIHRSKLYSPQRCIMCKMDTSYMSDISLADPWLNSYIESDRIGHTMFLINSEIGKTVVDRMVVLGIITQKPIDQYDYIIAQKPNVDKCTIVNSKIKLWKLLIKLKKNNVYTKIATHNSRTISLHNRLIRFIDKLFFFMGSYKIENNDCN